MSFPTPPPPGLTFWPAQWQWLTTALQYVYLEQRVQAATLASIQTTLEHTMSQDADLAAAVAANTEAVHAVTAALASLKAAADSEIADVQNLLSLLASGPGADQAVTDAIAAVTASTAELQAASETATAETADLAADDASVPPA